VRKPYRLIVFGPGGLGSVCIWEAAQSPAFELVGVRAYTEAKNGVDVGTLLGIEPMGVKATTSVPALLDLDCDCIIYTARDTGTFNTDEEILELLAAGKNVITPLPYQQARLFREKAFVERLEAACAQGRSVFHATGIDPDLISDRVVLGLTGLCTHIEHLKLQEIWDCDSTDPELLNIVGFGKPPEEARQSPVAAAVSTNLLKSICYTMEEALGVHYDRVVETHDYVAAPCDIRSSRNLFVKAGTVGRVTHRIVGHVDSKGAQPFFTMEYNWLLGKEMLPEGVQPNQYWIATIEGRPSVKMIVDIKASHTRPERFYQIGNLRTEPGYHGTIAPCLQAVPHVCKAPPGILPSFAPQLHWKQDLRSE
jgi:4-hydroxy-tetrahydrodipicolinate reductase